MKLKERARKLKTDIPAIFLALKDRETPTVLIWVMIICLIIKFAEC